MTGSKLYGVVAVPGGVTLLAALMSQPWLGHLPCGLVAVALTLPPAWGTVALDQWLSHRQPSLMPVGLMLGTLIRMSVALLGGTTVFLLTGWQHTTGVAFWFWLIAAYLSTLTVEVLVLARRGWVGGVGRKGEG